MDSVKQEFKVGDRVRLLEGHVDWPTGTEATVVRVDTVESIVPYLLERDGGGTLWFGKQRPLELISPAPTTSGPYMAQHNADGTLTLTPVQEAEAVERKPARGEVWYAVNDQAHIWITGTTDHEGDPEAVTLSGDMSGPPIFPVGTTGWYERQELTFIAHSLADALESGKITAADLR